LDLAVVAIQRAEDLEGAFAAAIHDRVDGLVVGRDTVLQLNRVRLVALAASHRLPAVYGMRAFVEGGGLMSYGPDLAETYSRAAYLIDKILRGAKPADVPVEQATKFEFVLNLKTAKTLGLTVLPSLQLRADRVVE